MVDGWIGDDWFANGAFRQVNFGYFMGQTTKRGKGEDMPKFGLDDYATFLRTGSGGNRLARLMRLPRADCRAGGCPGQGRAPQ